jgi:hypothetical protein
MRAIFVIIWFALVLAPIGQQLYGFVPEWPIKENRELARPPQLGWAVLSDPVAFGKAVYTWFNDNFGLRITLIRIRTETNYALGYSDRVHIGPDGWLNYRSVLDQEKVANESASLDDVVDRLENIRRYLAACNIRLLVVSVPQKDAVYPESLPEDAPNYPKPSAFDRMRAMLTERFGADHIDAEPLLRALKAQHVQAYYRTDFHWTDAGGNEAARAIVNRIAELEYRPDLRWSRPASMRSIPFIGWESNELPLFNYVWEQTIETAVDWQDKARGTLELTNVDAHFDPRFPLNYSFVWTSAQTGGLPPIAVVSNSYGEAFWRTGMHFHFDKVYSFRLNSPGITLTSALRRLAPDVKYFILQLHEGEFPSAGTVSWSELAAHNPSIASANSVNR